jgi:maltose-binding protein MalE
LNPASEDPAGSLLQYRLEEFQTRNPNVIIETRVKGTAGPGGLLDSLVTSSAAAPDALPDLVALPRELLEAAALKGLLLPYDSLTTSMSEPDWYPFAAELGSIQDDVFGLPFAGDAMVQVYHSDIITQPLTSWSSVIDSGAILLFPAASEKPYFTLAQYQANGGPVVDDQARPMLRPAELIDVYRFFQTAAQAGVMPEALLTQLQSDEQVWEAFNQNQAGQIATWSSSFLANQREGIAVTQIPTPAGEPFSLASGWVWALVGRDESKQRLAVDLAEFLTESQFLASWSQAAGFLPPRPSSLDLWTDEAYKPAIAEIAASARLFPPTDVLSSLEVPLAQTTIAVLKGQSDPFSAAQAASAGLTGP